MPSPSEQRAEADALERRLTRRLRQTPAPELAAAQRALIAYLKANPAATAEDVLAALGPTLFGAADHLIARMDRVLREEAEAIPS